MKNLLKRFLLGGLFFPLLISCIQDEAPNAECDIEQIFFDSKDIIGSPIIENNLIIINAKPTIDLTSLSPEFVLTKGAVIYPESGSTHDFSTGMSYQVTSEDKKWSKDYEIRFNLNGPKTNYSFENFEIGRAHV